MGKLLLHELKEGISAQKRITCNQAKRMRVQGKTKTQPSCLTCQAQHALSLLLCGQTRSGTQHRHPTLQPSCPCHWRSCAHAIKPVIVQSCRNLACYCCCASGQIPSQTHLVQPSHGIQLDDLNANMESAGRDST
jgi:hypothetical protein